MPKKNTFVFGGKTWHMTTSGKVLPYPKGKVGDFQKCMSEGLKGNMITGKNLTPEQKQSNKDTFADRVVECKVAKPSKPRGRPPAKK